MTTEDPTLPESTRDAAAYWFARVHSGKFTVGERDRFQQWRRADPENEREYRALDEIWQATKLLPEDDLRELLEAPEPASERRLQARRRWMIGAGLACSAAIVGGVVKHEHILDAFQQPLHVARYSTGLGEQRSETLPDGSVIQMNVSTELVVQYYAKKRSIDLVRGEATFEVTHRPDQPFLVDAGSTSVRVTGTVFNVRRDEDYVAVAVQSGSVEVSSGSWWNRERAMLTVGMMASTQADQSLVVETGDVMAVTAWRQGKVVFRDQPLEDMVREMNRYLSHPIYLADSKLKRLRMQGVFGIADDEAFLTALQRSLPITITRRPDGVAELWLQR